jgi:hypothetical protein
MIHGVLQHTAVLAVDEEAFRVWGRFDHGKATFGTTHLLIIVGIVVVLMLTTIVFRIRARRAARTFTPENPARLFREFCAAHGLKRSSRRLLQQLATARGLPNAMTLFIEPQHFDTKNLPPELAESAAELQYLRLQLFG